MNEAKIPELTREEAEALSRQVHVEALGLCPHDETRYVYFENDERELECVACKADRTWIPRYSTNIEHAMEALCKRGPHGFLIGDREEFAGGGYYCVIGLDGRARGEGATIAEAISRAVIARRAADRAA